MRLNAIKCDYAIIGDYMLLYLLLYTTLGAKNLMPKNFS